MCLRQLPPGCFSGIAILLKKVEIENAAKPRIADGALPSAGLVWPIVAVLGTNSGGIWRALGSSRIGPQSVVWVDRTARQLSRKLGIDGGCQQKSVCHFC